MLLFLVTRPTSPLHFEESLSCFLFTLDPVSQVAGVSLVQVFLIHERTCRQIQMDGEQELYLEEEEFGKNRNNTQTNKKIQPVLDTVLSIKQCPEENNPGLVWSALQGLSNAEDRECLLFFFLEGGASSIFYHN